MLTFESSNSQSLIYRLLSTEFHCVKFVFYVDREIDIIDGHVSFTPLLVFLNANL